MSSLATLKDQFGSFWHSVLRGYRLPAYLGILATVLVFWLFRTPQPFVREFFDRLDFVVYDQRLKFSPGTLRTNEHNIVIVDYDERSLAAEGQWPWSRFKIARLATKLAERGALVIGFDVFFPEYERNLALELQQRIAADAAAGEGVNLFRQQLETIESANPSLFDADAFFAKAMESTDVVLGFSFRRNEGVRKGVLPEPIFMVAEADNETISLSEAQGFTGNIDTLQNSASGGGFFDTTPDVDGIIRSYTMIQQYQNRIYPSLALDMARLYNFEQNFSAVTEGDAQGNFRELVGIRMGATVIPIDPNAQVRIPYIGAQGSFPYVSATDVLNDTLSQEQQNMLVNSLVLVGTTSVGLYDLRATPVQSVYPGVEIHANVLNAILSSAPQITIDADVSQNASALGNMMSVLNQARQTPFPSRPDWAEGAIFAAIIVIGIGLSMIYPYLGPALLALSSITFMVGMTAMNFYLWSRYNLDFPLVILLLLILLVAIINMTYGFLKEGLNKKVIKGMFDQYVPPAHIDAMLNDPDKYDFSGESKELSVLFSDIRNFTTISEKLKATELKAMLNDFFTPITGIIFDNNGTIDKYVGDMVMAFWGAPLDDPQHHNNAVMAALEMLKKVEELKPMFKAQGLPEVNIGIGINSGLMNVGDMGSTYRRAYTVIGDAVNLGARLEGITKSYGVKLLIGEQTYDGLQGFLCRQIDKVQVKGKDEPIRIYQPLCADSEAGEELKRQVEDYHNAYALYLQQQWDQSEALFRQLQQQDPDTFLYTLYLERIASLRGQQLPPDWDGTYRYTTK